MSFRALTANRIRKRGIQIRTRWGRACPAAPPASVQAKFTDSSNSGLKRAKIPRRPLTWGPHWAITRMVPAALSAAVTNGAAIPRRKTSPVCVRGCRPGDADLDGQVTAADYVIWRKNQGVSGAGWLQGNFNGDSAVDSTDYELWRANFGLPPLGSGAGSLAGATVPEPDSIALLALSSVLLGVRCSSRGRG